MKRLVAYILCICCITLLLSGCKQPPVDGPDVNTSGQAEPSASPTETTGSAEETLGNAEETTASTEPVNIEDIEGPLAQYVQTAMKENFELDTSKYGNPEQSTPVRIPKLLPFSEDASACQAEIQNEFDPWVEQIRTEMADGFSSMTAAIDYEAYLNDTIFSLVIHACSMIDLCSYRVYNFDIETGKRLDIAELMNKLQITDYTQKVTQIAQDAFDAQLENCSDEYLEREQDILAEQKGKNNSKENIEKAMPYVAEDGKVMVVINIYSIAGAEKYPKVFPLS